MQTLNATGRTTGTTDEVSRDNNSGDCAFCGSRAEGIDAGTRLPVCQDCGAALSEETGRLVTDGGQQVPETQKQVRLCETEHDDRWVLDVRTEQTLIKLTLDRTDLAMLRQMLHDELGGDPADLLDYDEPEAARGGDA